MQVTKLVKRNYTHPPTKLIDKFLSGYLYAVPPLFNPDGKWINISFTFKYLHLQMIFLKTHSDFQKRKNPVKLLNELTVTIRIA